MKAKTASRIAVGLLALNATYAPAATFNVATPAEFQTALNSAAANGQDDTIQVAAGTYALSSTLTLYSTENYSLTLIGAGADTTILDGGGARRILSMTTTEPRAVIAIEGITFQDGATAGNGAGLELTAETAGIQLEQCVVRDCAATGGNSVGGGAMFHSITGTVSVLNCEFLRNTSSGNVGGLAVGTDSGSVTVSGSTFVSNQVNNSGGSEYFGDGGGLMVYSDGASHAVINSNFFIGNTAAGGSNPDGGGLMTYQSGSGSTLLLEGNEFRDNTAGLGGGGCILRYNQSADVTVRRNVFSGNRAAVGNGGGAMAYIDEGTLVYAANLHVGNLSAEDGGGAWINLLDGRGLVVSNIFTANQSTNNGGGLAIATDDALVTVERNVFDSNSSGNAGGALNMAAGTGTVDARNNTLHNNSTLNDGGGLYVYLDQGTAQSELRNNILWGSAPNAFEYSYGSGGGSLSMTYSVVEDASGESWFGTGCITNNPFFRNAGAGNFKLNWTGYPADDETRSPCIDAGDPASPLDPDGTRADMGALHFPQGFAAMDTPHWWLDMHLLNAGGVSFDVAELTDTDNDEAQAWQEFIADTDPTNSASVFRILEISQTIPTSVTFTGASSRLYTLFGCSNLVENIWTNVPGTGPRSGAGGADSMTDTNDPPKGPFYRLQVKLP